MRKQFDVMLMFAGEGKACANVTTRKLDDINDIFELMHRSQIEGRIVLDIAA